jgi:hypothetical protein
VVLQALPSSCRRQSQSPFEKHKVRSVELSM